jgi:drug/metabolite transporter (DMT)-like permease
MPVKVRDGVKLALGLALAVLLDTVQQLAWKMGVISAPDSDSFITAFLNVLQQPVFLVVITVMVLRLVNWLKVLELADLSFAQPITALSYVSVAVASAVLLHEKLTLVHIAGVVMIVAGVWCVSRTVRASRPLPITPL